MAGERLCRAWGEVGVHIRACDLHFFRKFMVTYRSVLDVLLGADSEYGHKNDEFEKFQGACEI